MYLGFGKILLGYFINHFEINKDILTNLEWFVTKYMVSTLTFFKL